MTNSVSSGISYPVPVLPSPSRLHKENKSTSNAMILFLVGNMSSEWSHASLRGRGEMTSSPTPVGGAAEWAKRKKKGSLTQHEWPDSLLATVVGARER